MIRYISIILFTGLLSFSACKPKATDNPPSQSTEGGLPAISMDDFQTLLERTDKVDFVFYDLPFSSNVEGANARAAAAYFTGTAAPANMNCTALGRAFYNAKGEELIQAEFFFDGYQCSYFLFYKDKKPVYTSTMTDSAKGFFNQMLSMKNATPKAPNQ